MPRLRNHVNPLRRRFAEMEAEPIALPDTGEVEVELGCADARFLFERARADPARTHIGIEIREDLVTDVNQRAREAGLANLRVAFANANPNFDALFPNGRLDRVLIFFPDPWFKRRHRRRRVVTPELVTVLHRKLRPAGQLFFQSDVEDLARESRSLIERSGLFENVHGPAAWATENPFGARTLREVRCIDRDLPIWRLDYRAKRLA